MKVLVYKQIYSALLCYYFTDNTVDSINHILRNIQEACY